MDEMCLNVRCFSSLIVMRHIPDNNLIIDYSSPVLLVILSISYIIHVCLMWIAAGVKSWRARAMPNWSTRKAFGHKARLSSGKLPLEPPPTVSVVHLHLSRPRFVCHTIP